MARPNVPKFGNWDNNDDIPYTAVFNEARKNRGGKMINPNDQQENPEMFHKADHSTSSRSRNDPEQPVRQGPSGHRSNSKDDHRGEFKNSPARQRPVRSSRPSAGSDHSFDKSPLHPQAKVGRGSVGSASPAWDGRNNVVDNVTHGTPVRSRLKPATPNRGDESPDKGAAVPRFGEWDENDPQSAENFTQVFNKVREERNTEAGNALGSTPRHPSYETRTRQQNDPKKCCCPWW